MNAHQNIKIAVIGCGMWGRNIARICARLGVLHTLLITVLKKQLNLRRPFRHMQQFFQLSVLIKTFMV